MKILSRIMLILPLLACFMLPSCATITKARQDLKTMSQVDYDTLRNKVYAISAITSHRIAVDWDDTKKTKARDIITKGMTLISNNDAAKLAELDPINLTRALADKYGEQLGLSDKAKMDIQDATLLVDVFVGPIQLKVDGTLGVREQGLIFALLQGLEAGLR
jgi:hypothetical protein